MSIGHTSLKLGKRSKKISKKITYIAIVYTSKHNFLAILKIFLTWNFREIAILNFFSKKSHHKKFSKSFFWKSIWIHMIFDLYLLYKILIFFKNFTKNFQNFLYILGNFDQEFSKNFVKYLKKIKILFSKHKSKNMCNQMDFQKNDFENFFMKWFFWK